MQILQKTPSSISTGDNRKTVSWHPGILLHEFQLNGPTPDRVLIKLKDPFTSCKERAAAFTRRVKTSSAPAIIEGTPIIKTKGGFPSSHFKETPATDLDLTAVEKAPGFQRQDGYRVFWAHLCTGDPDFVATHSFEWLRDLAALDDDGPSFVQALLKGWLVENARFTPATWHPAITAMRLINMIHHNDFIFQKTNLLFRSRIMTSMARQARHLAKSTPKLSASIDRVLVPMAICYCGLGFAHHDELERQGRLLLKRELRLNVCNDGAHASRNPSAQLRLVLLLIGLVDAYEQRQKPIPSFLKQEITRMLGVLEFFKEADGHLPIFNGGFEDDSQAISAALKRYLDVGGSRVGSFIKTGYQKIQSARTRVLVDVGTEDFFSDKDKGARRKKTPQPASQNICFDSIASFQFSHAGQRIVTNCGSALSSSLAVQSGSAVSDWQKALLQGKAHSKLSVTPDDMTSVAGGEVSRTFSFREAEHGQLLEVEQLLTLNAAGTLKHVRRLFLNIDGTDFRGEDVIDEREATLRDSAIIIRFHLYPTVRASLSRDHRSVILATPGRVGWRFSSNCSMLSIEDSVYAGIEGQRGRSEQIVLTRGRLNDKGWTINWRFTKL